MTRMWRHWLLAGALAVCGVPGAATAASEVDILLDKLVEKGVLTGVEAGLIRREISETKEVRTKQLAKEVLPDNWKWKGDIRLRDEIRNRETALPSSSDLDIHRQRIRFRYGAEGKVTDELKAGFRIATGTTTDPISTNQSFNTYFGKKSINLDLAYVEYLANVPGVTQTTLTAGIIENPFWTVSPLVWDSDLSWDGAAIKLAQDVTEQVKAFSNLGMFSLDTEESEPASLWVSQAGLILQPFTDSTSESLKNLKLTGALAYHDYRNVANATKAGTAGAFTREATNTTGAKDFNQINPSFELASMFGGVPVGTYFDWVHNASAGSDLNDGFQFGLKVGKAKNPINFSDLAGWLKGGVEAGYYYQRLAADAAYDEYTDSDFLDGGTNNRGHAFYVTLATLKNSTLGVKLLVTEQLENRFNATSPTGAQGKDHEDRVQVDWVTKF